MEDNRPENSPSIKWKSSKFVVAHLAIFFAFALIGLGFFTDRMEKALLACGVLVPLYLGIMGVKSFQDYNYTKLNAGISLNASVSSTHGITNE